MGLNLGNLGARIVGAVKNTSGAVSGIVGGAISSVVGGVVGGVANNLTNLVGAAGKAVGGAAAQTVTALGESKMGTSLGAAIGNTGSAILGGMAAKAGAEAGRAPSSGVSGDGITGPLSSFMSFITIYKQKDGWYELKDGKKQIDGVKVFLIIVLPVLLFVFFLWFLFKKSSGSSRRSGGGRRRFNK